MTGGFTPYSSIAQVCVEATWEWERFGAGVIAEEDESGLSSMQDADEKVRARCLALFDGGVGVVAVDALVIFGFDFVPGDVAMGVEFFGDAADEVFDEHRIFVSAFGHGFFVATFEEGVKFGAGAGFDQSDEVFNPNGFARADLDGAKAALIVRAVFGNGFGTRAQGGNANFNGEDEIDVLSSGSGVEARGVIHHTFHSGDGRFFGQEVGKFHFQVRGGGIELGLHCVQDVGDVFHVDHAAVGIEHFDEAAHVGAFEVMGQIDKHADGGDGVLDDFFFVADLDGEPQAANADFVDAQFAMVTLALFVVHDFDGGTGTIFRLAQTGVTITGDFPMANGNVGRP